MTGATAAPVKVLALSPIPEEGAGCRFRVSQYIPYLRNAGFDVTVSPFYSREYFRLHLSARQLPAQGRRVRRADLAPSSRAVLDPAVRSGLSVPRSHSDRAAVGRTVDHAAWHSDRLRLRRRDLPACGQRSEQGDFVPEESEARRSRSSKISRPGVGRQRVPRELRAPVQLARDRDSNRGGYHAFRAAAGDVPPPTAESWWSAGSGARRRFSISKG